MAHDAAIQWAPTSNGTLLQVRDLKKWFPVQQGWLDQVLSGRSDHVRAVDGVSFDIRRGEVFGLAGRVAVASRPSVAPCCLTGPRRTRCVSMVPIWRRSARATCAAYAAGCRSSFRTHGVAESAHDARRLGRPAYRSTTQNGLLGTASGADARARGLFRPSSTWTSTHTRSLAVNASASSSLAPSSPAPILSWQTSPSPWPMSACAPCC